MQGQECSHKFHITPPSQWLEAYEVKLVKGNCSLPHPRSLLLLATSHPPFLNKTEPLENTCLVMFETAIEKFKIKYLFLPHSKSVPILTQMYM